MNPVKLAPAYKDYVWGGEKLKTQYNKKADISPVAESWELAVHKDGNSVVTTGEYKGLTLGQYIEKVGKGVVGIKAKHSKDFPILIKFIDAKNDLSIQVHPSDEYALKNEGQFGKTEMWYVLDCEEDANIYYGFSQNITKEEFEQRIKDNTVSKVLNCVKAQKGDVFFVPPGTVHAIGAGNVICEVQQNSNITYRVYDYNRKDKDGNTRPLHIEKAKEVINFEKICQDENKPCGDDVILASCDYFTVRKLVVETEKTMKIDKTSFHSLMVTEGNGSIKQGAFEMDIVKGDSIFVPAQNAEYKISGKCEVILSYL